MYKNNHYCASSKSKMCTLKGEGSYYPINYISDNNLIHNFESQLNNNLYQTSHLLDCTAKPLIWITDLYTTTLKDLH